MYKQKVEWEEGESRKKKNGGDEWGKRVDTVKVIKGGRVKKWNEKEKIKEMKELEKKQETE